MDAITSLMYYNSTLLGVIVLVGALSYIGANTISPENVLLRRFVGYLTGSILILIGVLGFYFGAAKEVILIYTHAYTFDLFRLEWTFVGAVAIVIGILLVRQSFRRM